MKNPVIIFGAKGLGKVALDIFQSNGVEVYCFLDDDETLQGKEFGEVAVIGRPDDETFLKMLGEKCGAFVASDDNKYRQKLVEALLENKVMPINAVHKLAYVAPSAEFGYGNLLSAGSIVNSFAKVANHCIIHTNAMVDYEAELEDFVQIGAGSIINSGVKLEQGAFIGSGVTIISGIKIGKKARIGAGSVVISDIKAGETVFGNPAQVVKS